MKIRSASAILAIIAALVASCDRSPKGECKVEVNGSFGSSVTVDMNCPSAPRNVVKDVTIKGKGNVIERGQTVLLRATSFDSRSGQIISAYKSGDLRLAEVSKKGLGDISEDLVGVKEGSRLVFKRPGLVDGNRQSAEIIVVDIFSTIAHGKKAPAQNPPPAGMPSLSVADGGGPALKASKQAIPDLAVVPYVEGSGDQVSKGDTIAAQYAIYETDGKIVDTTWNGGNPVALKLDKAMRGLSEGLVDQKVGSRVMVLIPSSFAQGNGDRIVVVDILGILSSKSEKERR